MMATLQVDLSQPDLSRQNFKPCDAVPWSFGNSPALADIYPGQADIGSLIFMSSPQSADDKIYFDKGLVLEASRDPNSARQGEVFGIAFELKPPLAHSQEIRIEVHFDYIAKGEFYETPWWAWVRVLRYIPIPVYRPGSGLGFRQLPYFGRSFRPNDPFLGAFSAFMTNGDLSVGPLQEGIDSLDVVTCQVKFDPDGSPKTESMRINAPFAQGPRFSWIGFPFINQKFPCPIQKSSTVWDPFAGWPWRNNPIEPYVLEIKIEASGKNRDPAGVAIRLQRKTGSGTVEAFEDVDALDTTRYQSNNWTDDLSAIRFAGASAVVGKPVTTNPPPSFGPLRIRIKKLLVDCS